MQVQDSHLLVEIRYTITLHVRQNALRSISEIDLATVHKFMRVRQLLHNLDSF